MVLQNLKTAAIGVFGVGSTATGITISLQAAEAWLRIVSLVVGIAVGCLTFYKLFKKP